ncbi:serine/threonine protein kinase [Stieleria varia]|uniref:Serine/threonine-protein kinase PknA n=1 Tax=Stieleria varia TaxID=2528005 RepID=A0A5C6A0I4_9BACT|nr:serine/threonine-protein kinase [Stieleria varia]TWT92820.1 Serine/threonine-protein kinase PknA [Stieleria varia]
MDSPEFLGPYRIGEKLGRGGMGTVYAGVHEKTGERVAVKLIAEHVSDEMRFRRRFDAEVETLKRLRHPNIVRLIGYGEQEGRLFYSMELVQGESLLARLKREKRLPWMFVLDVAIQVCSALKHAHDLGVIHRDLKPANLVLTPSGEIKLVDFGIAKIFGHEQTAEGSVLGTADYMAPEQATGAGITSRVDLYALGCVMYAMLCGRPPFRGKTVSQVIEMVKSKDPAPLDLIDPELPEDIVQIVHHLLAKDPADRPPTALAVNNRLKAMRAGLSRQMTLNGDNLDTGIEEPHVEIRTHGIDLSDEAIAGLDSTGSAATRPHDNQTNVHTGNAKKGPLTRLENQRQMSADPSAGTADPSAGTVHEPGAAPGDNTLPMIGKATKTPQTGTGFTTGRSENEATDDAYMGTRDTHFQTVADSDTDGGFFRTTNVESDGKAKHVFSIAALVIGLILAIVAVFYAMRKPTADQLLATIDNAVAAGQTDEAQRDIERFLKLHPQHPRVDELSELRQSYQLDGTLRRLRLQSKIRTSQPPVYETEFLAAMELRRTEPDQAQEKLQQWLSVFVDPDMTAADPRTELQTLAEFELARLKRDRPAAENERRLDELLSRVGSAMELPKEESMERLRAIIKLYEDEAWAAPAVQAARDQLNR